MIESKGARPGRLHVLTDFRFQQRWRASELAEMAIAGGADTIQFRQKLGPVAHRLHEADLVSEVCRRKDVPLIVNDSIDIALAVDAAGIHLGQLDFPPQRARRVIGDARLLGVTVTTVDQAIEAARIGADYVGFGPVFNTTSKDNLGSIKGLAELAAVCDAVDIPVIAIAGITPERARGVLEAGAYGIAVMTAVSLAEDPQEATAELAAAITDSLESRATIAL
ncbi:MAG: thiamine phosphate synthase [Rhodothermia bacterium]